MNLRNLTGVIRSIYGLFYIVAGANHFLNPEFYVSIMPDYLPYHIQLVYISGVAEVILGGGLFFSSSRKLAAWGIIALLFAVFPANVHMAMHPERFSDVPVFLLHVRLIVQGFLMYWAWLYTKDRR